MINYIFEVIIIFTLAICLERYTSKNNKEEED